MKIIILSIVLCLSIIQICPASPIDDIEKAKLLIDQEKYSEASEILLPIAEDNSLLESIRVKAYFYLSYCAPTDQKKLEYANIVLAMNNNDSNAHYRCAKLLYDSGKTQEALSHLRIALSLVSNSDSNKAKYLKLAAKCYIAQKDKQNSSMYISNAMGVTSRDPELFFMRGKVYSDNGMIYTGSAIDDFNSAIQLGIKDKNKASCYLYIGMLHEIDKNFDKAIEAYKNAYRSTNDNILKEKIKRKFSSFKTLKKWNS